MKKVLSFFVAFSMILSVFAILPITTQAAEVTLKSSVSYTHGSTKNGAVTMHGFPTRPYALSWPNDDGYRTGYIAFPFGEADLHGKTIMEATLNLTVSKTQDMNGSNSFVDIYAVDYSQVDGTKNPTSDILLTTFTPPSAVRSQGNYTYPVSIDIDLTEYLAAYPDAEGVGILLTNRDDQFPYKGMIGFYGYDEGTYAPTLSIKYGSEARVTVITQFSDNAASTQTQEYTNLYEGDAFTVTEEIAPLVKALGSKSCPEYYVRDEFDPIELSAGNNTVTVTYRPVTIASVNSDFEVLPAISGNRAALPKYVSATTTEGKEISVPVTWKESNAHSSASNKAYEQDYYAYADEVTVTKSATILPCDSELESLLSTGDNSDSAVFSGNSNPVGFIQGAGTAIYDTEFTLTEGTNKLIMYGDSYTESNRFSGAAALTRMMVTQVNDNYVFEYYDKAWVQSSVNCEYGVNYLLRTEINMTDKTYNLYISADGDSFVKLNASPAAFRSSGVASIDRLFISGSMEVTNHKSHWLDGFSTLSLNPVDENGEAIGKASLIKCTTNAVYTVTSSPLLRENGEDLYILKDVDSTPSIKITGDSSLDIEYTYVTISGYSEIAVVLVQGDDTITLPASVALTFSNSQSLNWNIQWDTYDVDKDTVGEYTAIGLLEGLEYAEIEATIKVRELEMLPYTSKNTVATNNGGWNWYVEPSGTHIQPGDALATRYESGLYSSNKGYTFTEDKTYMGWVEDEGTIVVAEYDHINDTYKRVELHPYLESDDHNNPAVVVLPDGRIMVFYSMHTNENKMYYCVTKNPEDISEWHDWDYYECYSAVEGDADGDGEDDGDDYNATYPSVFIVHDDEGIIGNDVIYVGWRGVHWKPTFAKFSIPDENGKVETIMEQTQFANTTYNYSTYDNADAPNAKNDGGKSDGGRRPYTKYDYDFDRNKIYITFTANHPDNDVRNHIYYIYLDIKDQNLYTAKGTFLMPLPKENATSYKSQGPAGTNGQWGLVTVDLVDDFPELLVFDATEQTGGASFNPRSKSGPERRGWTWDIKVNEKGEPCIVYVDVTATPPGEDGSLPTKYIAASNDSSRRHHYYWYARWDSDTQTWVKTFLTYGGKWFHENATQERCYSGGLTFDHNAADANVIYLAIPTMGEYGNIFEIYRWESEDHGATWTIREPLTQNSKINNARPNAIYNYKQNQDGTHAGPRLLWISGEYRYWMNYEYKTGVMTDFAADGFITQDSPEMFADAFLYADGEKVTLLPTGENVSLTGQFNITNISIGDGEVYLALAHYNKDGSLIKVTTQTATIPARSVPQIGMIGAPLMADGSLSTLGDAEIVEEIEYTATIEEGDRIKLFAWNVGIEHPMSSIISIPFDTTTEANKFLMTDSFFYDGTERLILDEDESTFNGWIGKAYGNNAQVTEKNNAAITKAPFGNTALHIYHGETNKGGVMASHALPDTNGKDYTIKFTMRYINELSWNYAFNSGFTLSHGIPVHNKPDSPCAIQFRQETEWRGENGRGTSGNLRKTRWFDGGSPTEIFHEVDGREGVGFYHDALMAGSLYTVTINVHPSEKTIDFSINDGHRTVTYSTAYVDADSFDWDSNPIDTITFSSGVEPTRKVDREEDKDRQGEIYIDNFTVEIAE